MPKAHGKKYIAAAAKVDQERFYTPEEAAQLVKDTSFTNFDGTIEVHLRLGIDPRHADQTVRSTASLPHGTGKKVRVLVFAQGDAEGIARSAGADIVGGDELIQRIEKENFIDFDVAVATPDMMGKVGRLGRVLGRRGLMPNPKSGTVVPASDLAQAVKALQGGKVEFRNDKTGLVHVAIGKVSFSADQIRDNLAVLMDAIKVAKPNGAKGVYIRTVTLTSTMGPGIPLDVSAVQTMTMPVAG
jgi:large subunit ribosomal protein L1